MWRAMGLIILLTVLSMRSADAWESAMIFDVGFGSDVPILDSTSSAGALPIGFVHLPITGGYLFLTVQSVSGVQRIVMTRFREDGTLDTFWWNPATNPYAVLGSRIIGLPPPDMDSTGGTLKARFSVGIDDTPAPEKLFLAQLNGGGATIRISQLDAYANIVGTATRPSSFYYTSGIGAITAISAGVDLGTSGRGVVAAIQGSGIESKTSYLVAASESPSSLSGLGEYSSVGFRINALATRADGSLDVVGTEGGQAMYMQVSSSGTQAHTNFNLKCGNGSDSLGAALDGFVVAPPGFDEHEVLVAGRADCTASSRIQTVARIQDIASPLLTVLSFATVDARGGCTDPLATGGCPAAYLISDPSLGDRALTINPAGMLDHFDVAPGMAKLSGEEINASYAGYPDIYPTLQFGASLNFPYLVGLSLNASGQPGIRRIIVDRIFADGGGEFTR